MNYSDINIQNINIVAKSIVQEIGDIFADRKQALIHLIGDLGAGKTTLVKEIAKEIGLTDHVQSPTFTLMREYDLSNEVKDLELNRPEKMIHVDAYRFDSKEEGEILNLKQMLEGNIVFVEWPEKMNTISPDLVVFVEKTGEDNRNFKIIKK